MAAGKQGIRAGRAYVELFADDSKLQRALKVAGARLKRFGGQVQAIGRGLALQGAAMVAPFAVSAKVFGDFEEQMANVSTMLDEPEKHMERFAKAIRAMAIEFGESTEALAGGLYDILSASIAPAKALDVLAVAVKAAKAGMTDTKTAADAITTILNSYGLAAERAGDVSDLLFSVVKRGKTTFAQLAPHIGDVASIAASAGVSLEDLGAAVATMTRNGVQTENAITAVNAVISSFLKPADEAVGFARELGFEMSSVTLQTEGLAGVFERIKDLPPDAISKLFPNIRALKGVMPALNNITGFADDMEVMANRTGATESAYRKMTGILNHSFRILKQAALGVAAAVGDALAEPLKKAAGFIVRMGRAIAEFAQNHKTLVRIFAAIAASALLAGVAMLAVGVGAVMLGGILAAIASPVGVVIAALAALGTALVAAAVANEGFRKKIVAVYERIRDYVIPIVSAFKEFVIVAFQEIRKAVEPLAAKMKEGIIGVWEKISGYIGPVLQWFKDALITAFAAGAYGVKNFGAVLKFALAAASYGIVKFVNEAQYFFTEKMPAYLAWFRDNWRDIFTSIWNGIKTFAKNVWENLKNLWDAIKGLFSGEGWDFQWTGLLEGFESTVKELPKIAERHIGPLESSLKEQMDALGEELAVGWQDYLKQFKGKVAGGGPGAAPSADLAENIGQAGAAMERASRQLDNVGGQFAEQEKKISVVGTFGGFALAGLGVGNPTERIAKASEQTAENTRKIKDKISAPVFI